MSQLVDIVKVVDDTPLTPEARARLFFEITQALGWELEGVRSAEDAQVYLELQR